MSLSPNPPSKPEAPTKPRLDGQISLGAILQAITVAGSMISAIFAAGGYVQHLRDDLARAEETRQRDTQQTTDLLQKLTSVLTSPDVASKREVAKQNGPVTNARP